MHYTDKLLVRIALLCVFVFSLLYIGEKSGGFSKFFIERISNEIFFTAQNFSIWPKLTVALPVKFHKQEHSLSCEIASLMMALNYKGANITESDLLSRLPFSSQKSRAVGNIWGDPNVGFVGSIDSKMPNGGYGVYEKPIYDLALNYRSAQILENAELQDLTSALDAGNPIVVWGYLGSGQDISWTTKDGKNIKAIMGEHARVLMGYTGSRDNPDYMILMDPIYGKQYWSTHKFLLNWQKLDYKAIVIY